MIKPSILYAMLDLKGLTQAKDYQDVLELQKGARETLNELIEDFPKEARTFNDPSTSSDTNDSG